MSKNQIKALLFDYGMVLCRPQPPAIMHEMASLLDMDDARFIELYWRYRLPYDRADMDTATYWNTTTGRELDPALIERLSALDARSWGEPCEETLQWVRNAGSAGLKTGLLSNMPSILKNYLENECTWFPRFDATTYSCDLRVCKPDARIYLHAVEALNVQPSETLFFDDRAENARGAERAGLQAIHFHSPEQAAREARDHFAVEL